MLRVYFRLSSDVRSYTSLSRASAATQPKPSDVSNNSLTEHSILQSRQSDDCQSQTNCPDFSAFRRTINAILNMYLVFKSQNLGVVYNAAFGTKSPMQKYKYVLNTSHQPCVV